MSDYLTMRELGRLLGTTSHAVGRALKKVGLRTRDGKPSWAAFQGGFCDQRWYGENYVWAWARDKTLRVLEEAGLERRPLPGEAPSAEPAGPPTAERPGPGAPPTSARSASGWPGSAAQTS
jgi:hypothetical protein